MSSPGEHPFVRPSRRNRLRFATVGLLSTGLLSIGSAMAWADDGSIVLDFVRHGQSVDNAAGIIDTQPPGTDLTPTGEDQASTVAQAIESEYGKDIVGLFASEEVRTQETAAQLADLLGNNTAVQNLSGLNEIPAGSSRATRRTASRASCTYWPRCRGCSGMYWCRMWATPA
jgi:ribonuclease H / adenosylcobalamin/alpha-ribazole phosphatase